MFEEEVVYISETDAYLYFVENNSRKPYGLEIGKFYTIEAKSELMTISGGVHWYYKLVGIGGYWPSSIFMTKSDFRNKRIEYILND